MGIDGRLVDMWMTRREDMLTTIDVLKELGYATEEGAAYTIKTLDRVAADRKARTVSK